MKWDIWICWYPTLGHHQREFWFKISKCHSQLIFRCNIDVQEFPFDKQHCYLKFSSWTHSIDRMNVTGEEINLKYYDQNQEWKLSGTETVQKIVVYPDGTYTDVIFHIILERRSMFYTVNLVLPIVLITLLSMLSFILPSDSGERLGVSVTLMLTVTVFMLLITEMIPNSSLHMARVEVFFVFCLLLIILIIIACVFISRIYNRTSIDPPMSSWTRRYILNKLSYMVNWYLVYYTCIILIFLILRKI